jgi:2',3'-cyclic-nucleotide 2'-phosphodiesterase (5'-nucleotidase family)
MNKKHFFITIFGAGLTACSSFSPNTWNSQALEINESSGLVNDLDDEIRPYRDTLSKSMNEIIGYSSAYLIIGRPCSKLSNWVADALLKDQDSLAQILKPNMVLLNVGGIRSSINEGKVTVGDIFRLMPFDNEVVWVKLPVSLLPEIASYLKKSGGEPISNAVLNQQGLMLVDAEINSNYFWVLTSDYLMNGGDNMNFFKQKTEVIYTNKLMRDSFLDQVKKEGTLQVDEKCRTYDEK